MKKKKNPEADINRKRPTLLLMGFVGACSISLMAFEYKSPIDVPDTMDQYTGSYFLEEDPIPVSYVVAKKVHVPKTPSVTKVLVQVLDDIELPEVIDEPIVEDDPDEPEIVTIEAEPEELEKEPDVPIYVSEVMPSFPGGTEGLFAHLSDQTIYPTMAKEVGVQGTVYLTFVVEKDGSITNVEVLKGIGGGCDEEAERVVAAMPKWSPGEQRGRPVRVQFNLPFVFKLQ